MGKLIDAVVKRDVQKIKKLLETSFLFGGYKNNSAINSEVIEIPPGTPGENRGYNSLHISVLYAVKREWTSYIEIVQMLINAGADLNWLTRTASIKLAPLHIIALESRNANISLQIIELLLKAGADVDHPTPAISEMYDEIGSVTPLYLAAQEGQLEIAQALLKNGAKVDKPVRYGLTPLHVAAHEGKVGVIEILLNAGAKINQTDNQGRTALHRTVDKHGASNSKQQEAIKFLLSRGADINIRAKNGKMPKDLDGIKQIIQAQNDIIQKSHDMKEFEQLKATNEPDSHVQFKLGIMYENG